MTMRDSVVVACGIAISAVLLTAAPNPDKAARRLSEATTVLEESLARTERGIPQNLLDRSDCVGVFPSVWKGAVLIGGRYGKGAVSCRTPSGAWSAPSAFRIEGGNVGFQIGGSSTDLILLFLGPESMNKLLRTSFTLGIDGAAAAGPVGRSASGQTDALLGAEIISYSRSHGLFAGVSVDGATLRPDHGSNRNLYGYEPKVRDLLQGAVTAPEAAANFLGVLNGQSPRKRLQEASSAGE